MDGIPKGLIRVRDADHALDVILTAMDRRWRVTVGFWEVRTEYYDDMGVRKRRKVRAVDPATGRLVDTFVHTIRTLEPFDVDGPTGAEYVTAMDAQPRSGDGPAIRRLRADRVTDITVHKRSPYLMRNAHFIGRVRQHAAEHDGEGWGRVAALTDDALWSLIDHASSTDDAIERASAFADANN